MILENITFSIDKIGDGQIVESNLSIISLMYKFGFQDQINYSGNSYQRTTLPGVFSQEQRAIGQAKYRISHCKAPGILLACTEIKEHFVVDKELYEVWGDYYETVPKIDYVQVFDVRGGRKSMTLCEKIIDLRELQGFKLASRSRFQI